MNLINDVWDLADKFMDNLEFVFIDENAIAVVATDIIKCRTSENNIQFSVQGYPKSIDSNDPRALNMLFLYEIIANSVNYCYWYGSHSIRPNGSDSTKMYKLLDESFKVLNNLRKISAYSPQYELEIIIDTFIGKLVKERFPLLDRRIQHLNEVRNWLPIMDRIDRFVREKNYSVDIWLEMLVNAFPGYGKDLFLKRAFLFIIEMYRRLGLFKEEIYKIPAPADYQIPKMLRSLGCIIYMGTPFSVPLHENLGYVVDNGILISEGSRMECEIRAVTVVVCKKIADLAGCSCADVDTYLFNKRHDCKDPFHLTVTSNY